MIVIRDCVNKGYDIQENSKKAHKEFGILNPYGVNLDICKKNTNKFMCEKTTQDNLYKSDKIKK